MPTITGTENDDTLIGTVAHDLISGLGGKDLLRAGQSRDTLGGGDGADTLYGEQGDDALGGGDGRDQLFGGKGDDRLSGGEGRDRLNGGFGDDTLIGGAGRDRFVYDTDDTGFDLIKDFVQGEDRIVFEQDALNADGDLTFIGTDSFSGNGEGEILYTKSGNTLILIDIDGDQGSDFEILLQGAYDLTAEDFVAG